MGTFKQANKKLVLDEIISIITSGWLHTSAIHRIHRFQKIFVDIHPHQRAFPSSTHLVFQAMALTPETQLRNHNTFAGTDQCEGPRLSVGTVLLPVFSLLLTENKGANAQNMAPDCTRNESFPVLSLCYIMLHPTGTQHILPALAIRWVLLRFYYSTSSAVLLL